jgi:hypothetical protein
MMTYPDIEVSIMKVLGNNYYRYHKSVMISRTAYEHFPNEEACMSCLEDTDSGIIIEGNGYDEYIFMCPKCMKKARGETLETWFTDKDGGWSI